MSHVTNTVFAIYDSKSESWSKPVFSRNRATVQRELRDVLSQGQTQYALHPADYTLFELGTWSEVDAMIEYYQSPEQVGCLIQYAPRPQEFTDVPTAA